MKTLAILAVAMFSTSQMHAANEQEVKAKKNSELIVGKWSPTRDGKKSTAIEFTKDGKFTVTGEEGGKQVTLKGTYKFIDDKTFETTVEGNRAHKVTVKSISASEMTTIDDNGQEEKFKAIK